MPSSSFRYIVSPSPIASTGRLSAMFASHAGSVTDADTTW
ncbi:Uncharacterised protein [Mycobacteroides abscessus subsp. abscessus]|nr:Uncharacterised protein [Mycobacteroides abscessus subsp. abscessus]